MPAKDVIYCFRQRHLNPPDLSFIGFADVNCSPSFMVFIILTRPLGGKLRERSEQITFYELLDNEFSGYGMIGIQFEILGFGTGCELVPNMIVVNNHHSSEFLPSLFPLNP